MHSPAHDALQNALSARIYDAGFDVLGAARIADYHRVLGPDHPGFRIADFDSDRSLVLLLGNTRRLWRPFLRAFRGTALGAEPHPIDAYTRAQIEPAVAALGHEHGVRSAVRYAFSGQPRAVAMQRLAVATGYELGPVGLCVHPEHGPWISLRAAVVFEVEGPSERAATPTCSSCTSRPCLAARDRVVALAAERGLTKASFDANWQDWLAMRDACVLGKQARFSEQQIRYHYLKDLTVLTLDEERGG